MEILRLHVFVTGIVQGVNFRHYARQQAQALGLSGWVRNLPDGRVEAVFEGNQQAVEAMVDWCRQGPSSARVEEVQVIRGEEPQGLSGFRIRPTGYGE
jgi:acylphosphatase